MPQGNLSEIEEERRLTFPYELRKNRKIYFANIWVGCGKTEKYLKGLRLVKNLRKGNGLNLVYFLACG